MPAALAAAAATEELLEISRTLARMSSQEILWQKWRWQQKRESNLQNLLTRSTAMYIYGWNNGVVISLDA